MTVVDLNPADGDEDRDNLRHVEVLEFDDFTYNVGGGNAPLISPIAVVANQDAPVSIFIDAYDFDDDALTLLSVDGVAPCDLTGPLSYVGAAALSPVFGAGTSFEVLWNPGDAYQYLAAGESVEISYDIEIRGATGRVSVEQVSVTVEGRNHAPVNDGVTYEDADVEENGDLEANGRIEAREVDAGDTLGYSVQGGGVSACGALTVDATGAWTYPLNNDAEAVQALGADETVEDRFVVEVSDGTAVTTAEVAKSATGADDETGIEPLTAPVLIKGARGGSEFGFESGDRSGASVSGAGDMDGDGRADIAIGESGADPDGREDAGESYVVFGAMLTDEKYDDGVIDLGDLIFM